MHSFLGSVAQHLYQNSSTDFIDTILVVPNRRTGVILLNELKKTVDGKPVWAPKIQTINDFVQQQATITKIESIQLIVELYVIYKSISGTNETFDNFYNWGELLLADFNDVDKYNVSPESVFVNVKNLKSIESQFNYLTDEQIETLKRFFNALDVDNLTKVKVEFLKIWEIMLPMYQQLKKQLSILNCGYEGMIYKSALQSITNREAVHFDFKKVCFIGFNALTPVEELLFEQFKTKEMAQFFWDFDTYYIENTEMEAGLFQRKYHKKFPGIKLNCNNSNLIGKNITMVAASTNYGQVHAASQILSNLPATSPQETALVLSDETLLLPVINNIPKQIKEVNITMGYPLTDSLMGNFIEFVVQCHQNQKVKNTKDTTYYFKNVLALLSHPFIQNICPDTANGLIQEIKNENIYQVTRTALIHHDFLNLVFFPWQTIREFQTNLELLITNLNNRLWEFGPDSEYVMELEFGFKLNETLKNLNQQLNEKSIPIQLNTYLQILRKSLLALSVPFEGEPISGIQIMGFLETRNLDFKNVLILSANEGMMPSTGKSASFIPYGLRKGFGLPTQELNNAMYAYYFYRLIQRANNVWIIYNSGSGGMSTGEKSRFAYQLEYDPNFTVTHKTIPQTIKINSEKNITIAKNSAVWSRLNRFLITDNQKTLSPSALSIYLLCPLRFYFRSVAQISETDEVDEIVDARIFGNIFHKAAELFYSQFSSNELITADILKIQRNNSSHIREIIENAFSQAFFGNKSTRKFEIDGKNEIIAQVIEKYLLQLIDNDLKFTPFNIVGLEQSFNTKVEIQINGEKQTVIVGGTIDRLDKTATSLRIIDYKTGKDKLSFKTLEDVFDSNTIKDTKAIFQTFVYSYILSNQMPNESNIKPMVYSVRKLFSPETDFEITSKEYSPFADGNFLSIKEKVEQNLVTLLETIFNKDTPFYQTTDNKICEYCPYRSMCGK